MSDTSGSGFTRSVTSAERILQAASESQKLGGRLTRGAADFARADEREGDRDGARRRISGEVVEERKDKQGRTTHVKIRTSRGDIEVERDGTKALPRKGQNVEIELITRDVSKPIQVGEAVNIRLRPAVQAQTVQQPQQTSELARVNTTPIDVSITSPESTKLAQKNAQVIDTITLNAPVADMQALIEAAITLRLTPVDVETLSVVEEFYNTPAVPVTPTTNNAPQASFVPVIDTAMVDVAAMQTAVTFMNASGKGAQAGRIVGAPDIVLTMPAKDIKIPAAFLLPLSNPQLVDPDMFVSVFQIDGLDINLENLTLKHEINVQITSIELPDVKPLPLVDETGVRAQPQAASVPNADILTAHQAGEIHAVITGQTTDKLPTMSVFFARSDTGQVFTLHAPVDSLVPGTQVTLIPVVDSSAVPTSGGFQNIPALPFSVFMQPAAQWPSLQDLTQIIAAAQPQVAQALSVITPSPANPAQLTPALMLFVAAIKGGDFSTWLGDKTMEALRRSGRGDVMGRIGQEAGLMARASSGPIFGEWQGLNIPVYHDGQYQKAALYYRDQAEEGVDDTDTPRRKMTRFIFDLSLSKMGGVQVDGLLRHDRLDIILRTEKQLSQTMQRDMRRVYTKAIGQTEFTGELSFQADPRQWVTIKPDERHVGVEA